MSRPRVWVTLWMLIAAGGCAWGGSFSAVLQTPDGASVTLTDGMSTNVGLWSLNVLVLTLPITDAVDLQLRVFVDGRVWDNKVIQGLQPMAPLVFAEDREVFALTATCLFRATDNRPHTIVVGYADETTGSRTASYTFLAPG